MRISSKGRLDLSPTKRALLDVLRRERGLPEEPSAASIPRSEEPPGPSFGQERLWFLAQLDPHSSSYNVPIAVELEGRLDVPALERSIHEVIRRHEILRTTFVPEGGRPVLAVQRAEASGLPVLCLEEAPLTVAERWKVAREEAVKEAQRPFDLGRGPLLRAKLLRLAEDAHVLLLTMHHIVADGWSMGVLVREVAALYDAFSRGRPSPLPDLPIQYADYAAWQRRSLSVAALAEHLAYFREQLQGAPPSLDLPTDRPRPRSPGGRGGRHAFALPVELSARLGHLAQAEGVTLFMALLSAWSVVLGRWAGQGSVVVGAPVANRAHRDTEELIGFFANTVALRIDLSGDPSFRELLARVKAVTIGAFAHEALPFERLVEELRPERDVARTPLFQVMFVLQNAPLPALDFGGLKIEPLPIDGGGSKFDLTLAMTEAAPGIAASFEYSADLFDHDTVARMASHLSTLLAAATLDPSQRIRRLSLLSEAERRAVLERFAGAESGPIRRHPPGARIHELFEAAASATPDAIAVAFEDEQLSYRELNVRADRLARHLQLRGVCPGHLVALFLDRSIGALVSIFGVLKAGGAYLPIDPLYPAARVAYLLDDARPRLLLAHRPLPPPLSSGVAMEVVWLSAEGDPEEQDPVDAAAPGAASARSSDDDLAYVIYTSGSTGAPKGVMVTHKSACNMALGQIRAFNVRDRDRVLQLASLSFDVSLSEILMALFTGATLVMARRQALLPGPELVRLLRDNRITNVSMTASTLAALPWGELPALETLIVGGEVCAPEVVARWAAGRSLFNAYGPTETTVCATRARWRDGQRTSIIGRPLENVTVYVLDEALEPAPIGLSGELYIGGSGVGRGYLRRPGLTAERFIPDPFGAVAGERLYRTGDRARFLPDGSLEYLGRIDDQLKIRGFRVEPGEIEANLTAHPLVREALVIGRDDGPQGERLYAFVAPAAAAALGDELRSYLRQRLPEHMVPQVIVALDALPRTPSGKLQKDALPALTEVRPRHDGAAPRSPIEELIASVWAEILGVDDVGVGDDFFDRGGHSLLATQMMSRLRKAFGVDLPLRAVFEAPTVAALASLVEATLREGAPPQALPIARVPRDGELALSSGQERLWLMHRLEPESPLYNIFSAVRLEGRLVRDALERSLRAMTRRHEVLRTTFAEVDGRPMPVIHEEVEIDVPLIDLGGLPPETRDEAVSTASAAEAARPFDLSRGPLLRAELLRLGDDDHVLLLTLHHIIADGWSMGVLVREVAALYSAFTAGAEPSLPELPIQFVDYAGWQRKRLDGEALERELAYWRRQLEGAPPSLDLPLDRPRPPSLTFRGASLSFEIQGALARALTALSRREGVTLYMTLLSALAILLGRHAGQSDVVVGTSIANRTRPETEGLIGFFINNLVLRVDLSEGPTFRALLARTREICLGAYAHQDVPFERLVTELHPRRDPSRAPLFQVLFVLQNAPMPPLELPGLRLSVREQPNETAKFDLTLFVAATSRGLAGAWSYKTDLFDASTIARLDGQFLNLLRDAVEDPDRPIADLSLITPAEQRALISGFNDDLEGVEDGA